MSAMKITDMAFPSDWCEDDTVMMNDEDFSSASSYEEANIVFEQWQTDLDEFDIMEVDEQIGSTLLFQGVDDEIFVDPCISPTGPLEELTMLKFEEEDLDRFSLAFLDDVINHNNNESSDGNMEMTNVPFEERYKTTLSKLAESMKRSQETRKSLQMKTPKTTNYQRSNSVTGVITKIEMSSQQLQTYLKSIRQA